VNWEDKAKGLVALCVLHRFSIGVDDLLGYPYKGTLTITKVLDWDDSLGKAEAVRLGTEILGAIPQGRRGRREGIMTETRKVDMLAGRFKVRPVLLAVAEVKPKLLMHIKGLCELANAEVSQKEALVRDAAFRQVDLRARFKQKVEDEIDQDSVVESLESELGGLEIRKHELGVTLAERREMLRKERQPLEDVFLFVVDDREL
jgi:hypothetical protein